MPHKIVILDGYAENPGDLSWDGIKVQGETTIYDRTAPEDVISRIGDAECIFTNKVQITKEIMDACPTVRYIGELATGFNNIDVAAAKGICINAVHFPGRGAAGQDRDVHIRAKPCRKRLLEIGRRRTAARLQVRAAEIEHDGPGSAAGARYRLRFRSRRTSRQQADQQRHRQRKRSRRKPPFSQIHLSSSFYP